jgi:hypothetical protein
MRTLHDVIAETVDCGDDPYEVADNVIAALLAAPESIRMELAWLLLPKGSCIQQSPAPPSEDKP